MLFVWQLWDMALPGLQEAGHSRATACAIFWNFPAIPAREYQQLLLPSCLRVLLAAVLFFLSVRHLCPLPLIQSAGNDAFT